MATLIDISSTRLQFRRMLKQNKAPPSCHPTQAPPKSTSKSKFKSKSTSRFKPQYKPVIQGVKGKKNDALQPLLVAPEQQSSSASSALAPKPTTITTTTRPIALESSLLGRLSPDLILYLNQFLPPESAASFSITCGSIYAILGGGRHLKALYYDPPSPFLPSPVAWKPDEGYRFLTLLERDLPDFVVCYHCKKLHTIAKADRYVFLNFDHTYDSLFDITLWTDYSTSNVPCSAAIRRACAGHLFPGGFSFVLFQMAMKQSRLGQDPSQLLNLMSTRSKPKVTRGWGVQRTTEVRIVENRLLFRQQNVNVLPRNQPDKWQDTMGYQVCPHHVVFCEGSVGTQSIIQTKLYNLELDRDSPADGRLRKCPYCRTEFQGVVKQLRSGEMALFFTTWMDLGEGSSTFDPIWQGHIHGTITEQVNFKLGSICEAFEQKPYWKFECDGHLSRKELRALSQKPWYKW